MRWTKKKTVTSGESVKCSGRIGLGSSLKDDGNSNTHVRFRQGYRDSSEYNIGQGTWMKTERNGEEY
jgi:hypothetical protein